MLTFRVSSKEEDEPFVQMWGESYSTCIKTAAFADPLSVYRNLRTMTSYWRELYEMCCIIRDYLIENDYLVV